LQQVGWSCQIFLQNKVEMEVKKEARNVLEKVREDKYTNEEAGNYDIQMRL
jgi:hypothetical protein